MLFLRWYALCISNGKHLHRCPGISFDQGVDLPGKSFLLNSIIEGHIAASKVSAQSQVKESLTVQIAEMIGISREPCRRSWVLIAEDPGFSVAAGVLWDTASVCAGKSFLMVSMIETKWANCHGDTQSCKRRKKLELIIFEVVMALHCTTLLWASTIAGTAIWLCLQWRSMLVRTSSQRYLTQAAVASWRPLWLEREQTCC